MDVWFLIHLQSTSVSIFTTGISHKPVYHRVFKGEYLPVACVSPLYGMILLYGCKSVGPTMCFVGSKTPLLLLSLCGAEIVSIFSLWSGFLSRNIFFTRLCHSSFSVSPEGGSPAEASLHIQGSWEPTLTSFGSADKQTFQSNEGTVAASSPAVSNVNECFRILKKVCFELIDLLVCTMNRILTSPVIVLIQAWASQRSSAIVKAALRREAVGADAAAGWVS